MSKKERAFNSLPPEAMADLVRRAQNGDVAAREEVCRRFAPLVYRAAGAARLALTREDAVQEAWLALLQAVADWDPAAGVPFAGYARARVQYALWNGHKRVVRRLTREHSLEAPGGEDLVLADILPAPDDPAEEAQRFLEVQAVRQALHRLPARQRAALLATAVQGLTLVETARRLGISNQAVHRLCQRARRNLTRYI